MGAKDYCTPPALFNELNAEYNFTLDAAASHDNALCYKYCTPDGFYIRGFKYDSTDGLTHSWAGERVFCNPPYDRSLSQWVAKALQREAEISVLLLPANTDTAWFHTWFANKFPDVFPGESGEVFPVEGYYDGRWRGLGGSRGEAYFSQGRVKFYRNGKAAPAPRYGSLLLVTFA